MPDPESSTLLGELEKNQKALELDHAELEENQKGLELRVIDLGDRLSPLEAEVMSLRASRGEHLARLEAVATTVDRLCRFLDRVGWNLASVGHDLGRAGARARGESDHVV